MSSGYIGQIFNSIQGEGIHVGKRQVFVRFAGCFYDCVYCDSRRFRDPRPRFCEVESSRGSAKFKRAPNPMSANQVIKHVKSLLTSDVHSVSLTGGEPLQAGNFLIDVVRALKNEKLRVYLETNGSNKNLMAAALDHVDIVAMDIKLPEHRAVPGRWPDIFEDEITCIKLAVKRGTEIFVKIVTLPSTKEETIEEVCERLISIAQIPLVLQPVTPAGKVKKRPSMAKMLRLSDAAARAGVENVSIIPQVHKLIGVL